jgi:arsenate reductase
MSAFNELEQRAVSEKVFNVLFLCTCNSARSLLAEAQLNALGKGRFRAFSAGTFPKGEVNPLAIEFLLDNGLATEGLRSKSLSEFVGPGAPEMDFVLTVCDDAAEDPCPIWPGQPISAHWNIADPSVVTGGKEAKHHAILAVAADMRRRIELLVALPTSSLDRMSLQHHVASIGTDTQ